MQIAIMGIKGRMGTAIVEILRDKHKEISVIGADKDTSLAKKENYFSESDVVIDFTSPDILKEHIDLAEKYKTPIVIGTTGISGSDKTMLAELAKTTPVIWSANMSLGVNLLLSLVEKAASALDEDFDIEILEAHHRYKKDAPSGTALVLGEAAAKGRKIENYQANYSSRQGLRKTGEIGYSVIRGGDIVGEHSVIFAGEGEQIIISHKARDRKIFASGAVKAALWLKDKPAGLYNMQDVLGV